MISLRNIVKIYDKKAKYKALDNVSINFRKSELVAILGPSGSGKTTLLNIIGGLDHYNTGQFLIDGNSTSCYKDKDWDIYRKYRVGFIFQNYNLISHQTVLANVELSLTLSGLSKRKRRDLAIKALVDVGLKDYLDQKPNQLSGGQMQRVAIARALINNPEIILADEPTGALDWETSLQIMEILKVISRDRLVIMVTHNKELANSYASRIVTLEKGKIVSDTNYCDQWLNDSKLNNNYKKKSISLKTAFGLSFKNLLTKKGRTFLVCLAGSIGIIGMAVILSISLGVKRYIQKMEDDTLIGYPLVITPSLDSSNNKINCPKNSICANGVTNLQDNWDDSSSDLQDIKKYIEDKKEFKDNMLEIKYNYDLPLLIYTKNYQPIMPIDLANSNLVDNSANVVNHDLMYELENNDSLLKTQYELLIGRFPKQYNELVLMVDENNQITDYMMYILDLVDQDGHYKADKRDLLTCSYEKILGYQYKLVINTKFYVKNRDHWLNRNGDPQFVKQLVDKGMTLNIVGIVKPSSDSVNVFANGLGYTSDLVKYVIKENKKALIVQEQLSNSSIDVLTRKPFDGITTSLTNNLSLFGYADSNKPKSIKIYPKNFEAKEKIKKLVNDYITKEQNNLSCLDYVASLMDNMRSITDIITISLMGCVMISLLVSGMMITIITHISVLERTREIGILRAIGASKKDISRVFKMENVIEGLTIGILGIILSLLINSMINGWIKEITYIPSIAILTGKQMIILILISIFLTVIAGLIPTKIASRRDPVKSLRVD